MKSLTPESWKKESKTIRATQLEKTFKVDFYLPGKIIFDTKLPLLIFNDGQILEEIDFLKIIQSWSKKKGNNGFQFVTVAIHASKNRIDEYGTTGISNEKGQGHLASAYRDFITADLLQYIQKHYAFIDLQNISIAGFSLGGLMALDIAWEMENIFQNVGVFSGALWWRKTALDNTYSDADRIMHQKIREGKYQPQLRFFFECGTHDETSDRNNNGIIDSIDDTLDLIKELQKRGYDAKKSITYLEIEGGEHHPKTWGKCMPTFLNWCWKK